METFIETWMKIYCPSLARAFQVADPVVDSAGGQVEAGDHVPYPVITVVDPMSTYAKLL